MTNFEEESYIQDIIRQLSTIDENVHINSSVNNQNQFDRNTQNYIDNFNEINGHKIIINENLECLPLCLLSEYETKYEKYENSDKIIVPASLLKKVAESEITPIVAQLEYNSQNISCIVGDFLEGIEQLYVPYRIFNIIHNASQEDIIKIIITNQIFPLANYIKIKPEKTKFIELDDPKNILEKYLEKNYIILQKNTDISIKYEDIVYIIKIVNIKPENICLITNTDINVEFEQPFDYVDETEKTILPQPLPQTPIINNKETGNSNKIDEENVKEFVPFSGKGYKLSD